MSKNPNLLRFLYKDILQYVFNLYIDYENDSVKLENIVNTSTQYIFKFDINPHIFFQDEIVLLEASNNIDSDEILIVNTYIDNNIVKKNEYWDNSIKKSEINYKQGSYHGKNIEWFKNGNIEFDGNYENGFKHGIQIRYNSKGVVILSENYNNGIYDGNQLYGEIFQQYICYNYKNGKLMASYKSTNETKCEDIMANITYEKRYEYQNDGLTLEKTYEYGNFVSEKIVDLKN
jgi:antitoxin component YwqK of YwqJK toxin-antitoxin module